MKPTWDLALGLAGLRRGRTAVNDAEASVLSALAIGAKSVVEVGVAEGVTSARLLEQMAPDGVLFMIDPYPARLRIERWLGISGTRLLAKRSVRRFGGRAVFLTLDSVAAASSGTIKPAPSLIFLDARHDYAAVAEDLRLWSRRLAPEGVVAVHDAVPCETRPELRLDAGGCLAVAEAVGRGWEEVTRCDSLAVLRPR